MNANKIREVYLEYFKERGHTVIPRANLVPQDDPTTLFTGSGMQPLIPYLLGESHTAGARLVDSQTCFRAEDIDEIGDNRHTTFFEMLGNWSLGDYFKEDQIKWVWEFLVEKVGLDSSKIYVTVFIGDEQNDLPKDEESAELWQKLYAKTGVDNKIVELGSESDASAKGMQGGRIFYYDVSKNWWSRVGKPVSMPVGEPGGPDTEIFYDFGREHKVEYGKNCHPNCDCGRFLEIGNSVFMQYIKTANGFKELPKKNVDFGGGLERIAAASADDADMFKIELIWPIVEELEAITRKKYYDHIEAKRIIADHVRAAVWLIFDGVVPGNKAQSYVLRRLLRRALRQGLELGVEKDLFVEIVPVVINIYKEAYPEITQRQNEIITSLDKEEKLFRQTLRRGLRVFEHTFYKPEVSKIETGKVSKLHLKLTMAEDSILTGNFVFTLYDTYGFPSELSLEEAKNRGIKIDLNWEKDYKQELEKQRERSRTAAKGMFKGGLAEHSEITTKYHTATHMMYKALRLVLGDHVIQRGSNITNERLRFDFSHPDKMNQEQIDKVEDIVNKNIKKDWTVSWREMATKKALDSGGLGAFGDRYGDKVRVYTVGDPDGEWYSQEICGGPHVEHTGALAEGGKKFKITKEESSSAGVRRIKAVLQ
jgi:alanyl-tRNA synthetase